MVFTWKVVCLTLNWWWEDVLAEQYPRWVLAHFDTMCCVAVGVVASVVQSAQIS
jgi:hypothetical protein